MADAVTGAGATPALDDIDKALIRLLQTDGRMPYSKLGPAVGLSSAAARQRVQRLMESGVIEIVAVSQPLKLGFHIQAMVGIRADGDIRALAAALAEVEQLVYVVVSSGHYDLIVELVCTDARELLAIVNDRIRTLPGVTSTETYNYLYIEKVKYAWGTA
ncbi:Lrp/AsnC family transcriptional regulator [Agromyces mediolanus]|uniref:Lrp/AsnC family transcriptional regulator n=1 Tax=Agromyces mediolanus TaxID=41986 RepID=UPI0038394C6F